MVFNATFNNITVISFSLSNIDDFIRCRLFYLDPYVFLMQIVFLKLFSFAIVRLWAYLMKVITVEKKIPTNLHELCLSAKL